MTTITVTAQRWDDGWELIIDNEHATQVHTLDRAAQQVRDYLDTDHPEVDHSDWEIDIIPCIEGWDQVKEARQATHDAARAQERAAAKSRAAVRALRAQGLSVTDCAQIMGISRGRVSQLTG